MFGRHSNLAIDCLGLNSLHESDCSSREHYAASKLKKLLGFCLQGNFKRSKSATRHLSNYDGKVREATCDVGDRVLIRKVGPRVKIKLANKWDI